MIGVATFFAVNADAFHVFQSSAEKYVYNLQTSANAEYGNVETDEIFEQRKFEFILYEIDVFGLYFSVVERRKDVSAAD